MKRSTVNVVLIVAVVASALTSRAQSTGSIAPNQAYTIPSFT